MQSFKPLVVFLACTACGHLTPPEERMHGLWRNDFEGSQFCAAPATTCAYVSTENRTKPIVWMDFSISLPARWKQVQPGGLYAVDFVGRHYASRGGYGHMGVFDEAVIVDRMISIREVEAPPKRGE